MERTSIKPMVMYGSFVTGWIRRSSKPLKDAALFSLALTPAMVDAIIEELAHIWGNSADGFEYVEGPEPDWTTEHK